MACNVESRLRDGHNKDNSVWMGSSEKNLLEMEGELKNVVLRLENEYIHSKVFSFTLNMHHFQKMELWTYQIVSTNSASCL